jgi:hypothetical protein
MVKTRITETTEERRIADNMPNWLNNALDHLADWSDKYKQTRDPIVLADIRVWLHVADDYAEKIQFRIAKG